MNEADNADATSQAKPAGKPPGTPPENAAGQTADEPSWLPAMVSIQTTDDQRQAAEHITYDSSPCPACRGRGVVARVYVYGEAEHEHLEICPAHCPDSRLHRQALNWLRRVKLVPWQGRTGTWRVLATDDAVTDLWRQWRAARAAEHSGQSIFGNPGGNPANPPLDS